MLSYSKQFVYDWGKRDTHHVKQFDAAKESNFIDFMHQTKTPVRRRLPEFVNNTVTSMDYLTGHKSTCRSYSTATTKFQKPANCDLKRLARRSEMQRQQQLKM